jgi:predicted HicB family RNase H-like nuclease
MGSEKMRGTREAEKTYSGKVNLRMPKSLHRDLARRAEKEGVSLNQFMIVALARAVGEEESMRRDTSLDGKSYVEA